MSAATVAVPRPTPAADRYRVPGEDSPAALRHGFMLLGLALALAALWLLQHDELAAPAGVQAPPALPVPPARVAPAPAEAASVLAASAPVAAAASAPALECPPLASVTFAFDSATLPAQDALPEQPALLRALALHPQSKLLIQGYADATGADPYNLMLSFRRAKAVAALLAQAEVPAERLAVRAAGSQPGASASAMRRVTVEVSGIPGCPT